jgi:Tfp pilus assembly protein PilX
MKAQLTVMTSQRQVKPHGLALPTVMALSMLCSVLLLACWRNMALSQGWSRSAVEKWQLRQSALAAISEAANRISASAVNPAQTTFPTDVAQWRQWETTLPANTCAQGICRNLLKTNKTPDWLTRQKAAIALPDQEDMAVSYWVEVWPSPNNPSTNTQTLTYRITAMAQSRTRATQSAWQAVWQPASWAVNTQAIRQADMQSVLELQP